VSLQKLRDAGYRVVSLWGVRVQKTLCDNPGLENEICLHPQIKNSPINIRIAFYGGTTEDTKIYYRVKQGKEIRYGDVISLYHYICKYGKFPLCHPKV